MSLIDSLPRVGAPKLPKVDGLIPWIVPLAIVLVWQLACVTGYVPSRVLPAPTDVALAGWKLLLSGELVRNIWVSFWRASIGFLIGGGIGFAFGLANGLSQLSAKLTDTTLQMVRNIPHLALIPLVILWFGIDESAKLFLVALGVFFPIYLNTLHGIRTVDPQLIEMGRIYGMAEQLGFQEVLGDGGAVDRDEWPLGAGRAGMDVARQHFLARAGLAGDHDAAPCETWRPVLMRLCAHISRARRRPGIASIRWRASISATVPDWSGSTGSATRPIARWRNPSAS